MANQAKLSINIATFSQNISDEKVTGLQPRKFNCYTKLIKPVS
jgi:hypothetical protein